MSTTFRRFSSSILTVCPLRYPRCRRTRSARGTSTSISYLRGASADVDVFRSFLQDLKITCLEEEPGNVSFWVRVTDFGRAISLISQPELGTSGGKSKISEARAKAVSQLTHRSGTCSCSIFVTRSSFADLMLTEFPILFFASRLVLELCLLDDVCPRYPCRV